ncbi:glycosyltransferase family 117 protein [Mucilaginibacter ginkgonis]|uniref:DUF2723 domain-containing protein n=1 Tax=Mucilaginibacter ginkgonis TaxID=2682091 RepID=A0A6I4I175_9SPHI|nr:DUF2723 domain-containing protein [Mucilaginibacter ginkgonis]QQL48629.1 DUF2723 domain-containing protein [Mucilaginibacter ginkgonis]
MNYTKTNNLFGWIVFLIASLTYILTLEPSASFWDCGEFIACIYRLQVAHQPGAPLFTMIGKAFSLLSFGDRTKVAYFTNLASALASGATILFLFWTITALAKKLVLKAGEELTTGKMIAIIGAGVVGALAYTWSDTFWFSAVESEVYAESSLCTAIVFWAILKWEAHADEPGADKWLIFIAYVMGLSIGIHLLNLLVMPAIALVIYFKRSKNVTPWGTVGAFMIGVLVLAAILWGIIQYTVKGAAYSDLLFVNSLGMGFGTGAITFYLLLLAGIILGIYYTTKPSNGVIIASAICFVVLLTISAGIIGFIAGVAIMALLEYVFHIREKRFILNTVLICTLVIILGYSSFVMIIIRAKAGTNLNNSDPEDAFALNSYLNRDQYGETPLMYGPYFDSRPDSLNPQTEGAKMYRRGEKQYEMSGRKFTTNYDRNVIFPRIFSQTGNDPKFYREWLQMGQQDVPNRVDNFKFFWSWQVYQMYTRYFLWNFAGRTNEMDGQDHTNGTDGNWTTGFKSSKSMPFAVTHSKSYNRMYALPLIIGLFGLIYHFRRKQRDAGVVLALFFFTGLAIVLYLNQDPGQPRERDYAYAGSFYAFAIWIGLGVIAIADLISRKLDAKTSALIATVGCLVAAPVLMASQEWDDHDRSTKTTPRDMAANYLNSCAPNAILFTYGDNDTYPLWYAQEVEGVRPDIRIVNLSLLGTDWYIRQMKMKMNDSAPLPIAMPNEKFEQGVRDVLYFADKGIQGATELKDVFDFMTSDNPQAKVEYRDGTTENYLPTKDFKITTNADSLVKMGVVPESDRAKIAPAMTWKYPSNYVTKDNLAMIDILAHNNWKRPIYFAITVGSENLMGMENYLYDEGFANRLLPMTPDTTANGNGVNTDKMYTNMMTKFKWGNMKNARYLDHESLTMFYHIIVKQFITLTDNLLKENKQAQAAQVLKKYDAVMPDLYPYPDEAAQKYYLIEDAYKVNDVQLGNKWANMVDGYLVDVLNFNSNLMANGGDGIQQRDVQLTMSVLNALVNLTKEHNQTALYNKFNSQLKNYEGKLGSLIQQHAQQ